jgi:hypothetical protein
MCQRWDVTFCHRQTLGTPSGTTIINMDNEAILKVNLEDQPDDQKALIE